MPSREEFFATGLVPTDKIAEPECPICRDDYTDPHTVPCPAKHTFCRVCITSWLSGAEHNTCPFCRAILFEPKPMAMDFGPNDAGWENAVREAHNLLQHREIIEPLPTDLVPLQAAGVQHATDWLLGFQTSGPGGEHVVHLPSNNGPVTITGPTRICFHSLSYRVVAMGHMIPIIYEAARRPWTQPQLEHWIAIMQELPNVLEAFTPRDNVQAEDLPGVLSGALIYRLEATDAAVDENSFFEVDAYGNYGRSLPLDYLLKYIAFEAWLRHKQRKSIPAADPCVVM